MSVLHKIISYNSRNPLGSASGEISSYIVSHLHEIPECSIDELAARANVSAATILRQIKAMCGLTYKQFQKEITQALRYYPDENHCFNFYRRGSRDKDGYLDALTEALAGLRESCDGETLEKSCAAIQAHRRIRVYVPFAHSAAKGQLQMDLMVSGKETMFLSRIEEWRADVSNLDSDSLLIVSNSPYSNDFSYVDYMDLLAEAKARGAFLVSINALGRADEENFSDLRLEFKDTRTAMNAIIIDAIFNLIKVVYRREYMLY